MGGALLKGWLGRGVKSITVVEPRPSVELKQLARAKKIALFAAPSDVKRKPSVCVVAIKPQVLKGEAQALAGFAQSGALMISIAAGTSVTALSAAWGKKARIIRAMPNTPGAIGHGITGIYAARSATAADRIPSSEAISRYVAEPARIAHQVHECALQFQTAMQGVSAGHESCHLAKIGIHCLR